MRFNSPGSSLPLATRGYKIKLFPSRARHDTRAVGCYRAAGSRALIAPC